MKEFRFRLYDQVNEKYIKDFLKVLQSKSLNQPTSFTLTFLENSKESHPSDYSVELFFAYLYGEYKEKTYPVFSGDVVAVNEENKILGEFISYGVLLYQDHSFWIDYPQYGERVSVDADSLNHGDLHYVGNYRLDFSNSPKKLPKWRKEND